VRTGSDRCHAVIDSNPEYGPKACDSAEKLSGRDRARDVGIGKGVGRKFSRGGANRKNTES